VIFCSVLFLLRFGVFSTVTVCERSLAWEIVGQRKEAGWSKVVSCCRDRFDLWSQENEILYIYISALFFVNAFYKTPRKRRKFGGGKELSHVYWKTTEWVVEQMCKAHLSLKVKAESNLCIYLSLSLYIYI
jgi:hypothetical protein